MLSLVDRATGRSKSFVVKDVTKATLLPILRENIAKEATIYTDEAKQYIGLGFEFRYHNRIANGSDDRVRADTALAGIVGKRLTYQTTGA